MQNSDIVRVPRTENQRTDSLHGCYRRLHGCGVTVLIYTVNINP